MTGGIKDIHREAIIAEIAANDRIERAVLFGSRAAGTNTVTSDVDIALFGNRLTRTDQVRLAAALEEIPMAQTVDLVLYHSIRNKELESHIRRHGIEWYTRPAVTDNGHAICSSDRTEFVPLNSECTEVDIPAEELKIIQELLKQHLPDTDAWIYDLRGKHASISEADFILVVFSSPAQKQAVSELRDGLKEDGLSFKIDVFVWDDLPESLKIGAENLKLAIGYNKSGKGNNLMIDSDWQQLPFSEAVQINPKRRLRRGMVYPFVSMASINVGSRYVSPQEQRKFKGGGARFREGDTLMARITPCLENGKIAQYHAPKLKKEAHGSTEFIVIRGCPEVTDNDFAYYLTKSERVIRFAVGQMTGTSGRQRMSAASLKHLVISLPPISQQRLIAHILGTIDDKIELNRRMSKTLEAMSRALFKSWFIDFDPVRAKMEGLDTGLPKHIADLFPDRLIDSELGEIPEGWEVKQLKECMNLTMGQSPPSITYNDRGEGLPFFQGSSKFGFRYARKQRFCSAPVRIALSDDTLISVRAPVGDINMAWERCCIGRGLAALRHKSGSHSFTYYSAWALQGQLKEYEHTGTVFGAINKGQFETLMIIEPSAEVLVAFDTMSASFDQRIRSSTSESHNLEVLRDVLLPKLISGEIRLHHSDN